MMAVTAFESYIEDYLREIFPPRLAAAETPENFMTVFEVVALRGRFAHVARKGGAGPTKYEISRLELRKFLAFFEGIVAATEKAETSRRGAL